MSTPQCVVIVGASVAGLAAAETLRLDGFDGKLTVVDEASEPPHDRPPLSKQVLSGRWGLDQAVVRSSVDLEALNIDWRLGTRAVALDVPGRILTTGNGERIAFDDLLIATGVTPRQLEIGGDESGIHVLRDSADCLAIKASLVAGARILVAGGGVLGTELAATARALGLDVTLVASQPGLLSQFGAVISDAVTRLHERKGVNLRFGSRVSSVESDRAGAKVVRLIDGSIFRADVVLTAVGSLPAISWLAGSGLILRDGVECDSFLRAARHVYAAGDVASWWHHGYRRRLRLEHRTNAFEQGCAAARNMLGANRPFCEVPYMWTDQYDLKIQAFGIFPEWGKFFSEHSDSEDGKHLVTCRLNGRTVGAVGWGSFKELRAKKQIIRDEMMVPAGA